MPEDECPHMPGVLTPATCSICKAGPQLRKSRHSYGHAFNAMFDSWCVEGDDAIVPGQPIVKRDDDRYVHVDCLSTVERQGLK